MVATSDSQVFTTVAGDRHSEVPRTLAEPVPRALSLFDQLRLFDRKRTPISPITATSSDMHAGSRAKRVRRFSLTYADAASAADCDIATAFGPYGCQAIIGLVIPLPMKERELDIRDLAAHG
ncbi:MAG TPA: hypothetical protein VKR27_02630 [Acidimicrobiales bacterium]|nr:hypothetical protein [Acidimicrobiales bacterium]